MSSSAYRVALIHLSKTQDNTSDEETSETNKVDEQLTLAQKKKVIEDSIDSYYSPVINTYLRQFKDIGQLVVAAQYVVSLFGETDIPLNEFQRRLGNIKVKVLNAVGDTAMDEKYSLKQTFLNDPQINTYGKKQLEAYVRTRLGAMKRDTITKIKKVEGLLHS